MGYTTRYDDFETVSLSDDYWVKVKKCLTGDEEAQCQKNTINWRAEQHTNPDGTDSWRAVIEKVDPTALDREYAIASLVEWNIDDNQGNVLSLATEADRRKNYGLLTRAHQQKVEEVVGRLNSEPTRTETTNFPSGGKSGVPARQVQGPNDSQVRRRAGVVGPVGTPSRPSSAGGTSVERSTGVRADNGRAGDTQKSSVASAS